MKSILSFIALLLFAIISSAQIAPSTPWTWMKGDNTVNQPGLYNIQGIANATSKPGGRDYSTTWKDAAGNLWLFGGYGYGSSNIGYLNDLWKYDPSNSKWTWMKGATMPEQFSNYGIKGIANTTNTPGATYAGSSWADASGNLWLFGGFGYSGNSFGCLNSLWKYNIATNEWTWVNGDNTINESGNYGVQGTENENNKPGARCGSQTWIDPSGNLWLLGGFGYSGGASGMLNDIWKYNPSTNKWSWIKGNDDINLPGVYGSKGISNSNNMPGSRYLSSSWSDHTGNLWLFGGNGYDENSVGDLNDLWKYNLQTNEWTWISGDKEINQPGVYGSKGVSADGNKPGARYISNSWMDALGGLWLFGGFGHDATNTGSLNDLWKYNTITNKWTWVKGDNVVNQMAVYGTQGMPDVSNKSGARYGSQIWANASGDLWLFGGYGFDGQTSGSLNDLWKITSYITPLPLHLLNFSGVLNNSAVRLQWESEQETAFSHFNIQRSFDGTNFSTIGNISGSGNNSRNNYNYNDNDLQNRQEQKVYYRLQMMDKDGKFTLSKILVFDLKQSITSLSAFPNPAVHSLNLSFTQNKTGKVVISITDMRGVTIKKQTQNIFTGTASISIDVSGLTPGTYIISLTNEEGIAQQKFIKQ